MVFDLGNTLVDYPLGGEQEQLAFLEEFLVHCQAAGLLETLPHGSDAMERLLKALNAEREDCRVQPFSQRLVANIPGVSTSAALEIEARLARWIAAKGELAPGATRLLELVRRRGMLIAIATNAPWGVPADAWRAGIDGLGIDHDVLICCGDVGLRKPDPALILACCEALGVPPQETVVVGDSPHDVGAASAAGCAAILLSIDGQQVPSAPSVRSLDELHPLFA